MKTVLFTLSLLATLATARAEDAPSAAAEGALLQDAGGDYETPGCFSNLGLEDRLYCNRFTTRETCEAQTWGLRQYRCHWND